MMKTILVHVEEHEGLESVLASALLVARRFGSHIEGLHVRPGLPRMVPVGIEGVTLTPRDVVESLERGEQELGRRLRDRFDAFMRAHDVPRTGLVQPLDGPSAGWLDRVSPGDDALGTRGRVFDLIVVGRPGKGVARPAISTVETALFESGRPALIASPRPPETIGETMVIAWNGSTETARTIAFAMPFLARAGSVLVLSVHEGMVPGPTGAEVAHYLLRNDIPATARHVRANDRSVGETILAESAALGADLLVKGAYTQSRLRQMIFGGATSHILANAEIPVIMAH
jgi:nucleotide-binding universal stress UspA family protein